MDGCLPFETAIFGLNLTYINNNDNLKFFKDSYHMVKANLTDIIQWHNIGIFIKMWATKQRTRMWAIKQRATIFLLMCPCRYLAFGTLFTLPFSFINIRKKTWFRRSSHWEFLEGLLQLALCKLLQSDSLQTMYNNLVLLLLWFLWLVVALLSSNCIEYWSWKFYVVK